MYKQLFNIVSIQIHQNLRFSNTAEKTKSKPVSLTEIQSSEKRVEAFTCEGKISDFKDASKLIVKIQTYSGCVQSIS